MIRDAEHAVLEAEWQEAFAALKAAGMEHDADDPIAARYRSASDAVNHANRSRDFAIFTGQSTADKWIMSPQARRRLLQTMQPVELRDLAQEIARDLTMFTPDQRARAVDIICATLKREA